MYLISGATIPRSVSVSELRGPSVDDEAEDEGGSGNEEGELEAKGNSIVNDRGHVWPRSID